MDSIENTSALLDEMRASPLANYDFMVERFPRLARAMQWAAILSSSEAGCALRDYVQARDGVFGDRGDDIMRWGGGEAVAHYGGPRKLIRNAASYRVRSAINRLRAYEASRRAA